MKSEINDTFAGLSFNSSLITVPAQNELTFCNDLDTSVVDDLGEDLIKVAKIGVVLIILLALILTGFNCLLEWYKWRCQKRHLEYTRQAWSTDSIVSHTQTVGGAPTVALTDYNLLMLQANGTHPLITRIINQLSARLHFSPTTFTNFSWFLHYIFHPPALACFLIGFFGLLSVELQVIAIRPLEAKYSALAAASANDLSSTIVTSINASMFNQSAEYANNVNGHIDAIQSTINDGLFGWVNITTTTLNNTIATFYSDIQDAITDVFNGTLLEQPLQEFISCFIGSKVQDIEEALTFLQNNLQIDMPRMNESVLVLSPESVNEVTQPIAAAAVGNGSSSDGGFVGKLVNDYVESLQKERLMFGVFMGLWAFVVFMGICILLWSTYGKRLIEKRRQRKWVEKQRGGVDGLVVPFRLQPNSEKPITDFLSASPSSPRPPGVAIIQRSHSAGSSKAPQSLDSKTGKSWENFFGGTRKKTFPTISKPFKLMSVVPKPERTDVENGGLSSAEQEDKEGITWLGRFAAAFGRKASDPASPPYSKARNERSRPELRISIGQASSIRASAEHQIALNGAGPHSRWSTSPEVTKMAPWMGMLSPTRRSYDHNPPTPVVALSRSKTRQNVPADVNSVYESSFQVLAPPLHHGFNGLPASNAQPPVLRPALEPPRDRHRRSSSVPAWKVPAGTSVTPVTRFLTSNSVRRSSNVDPFATPFDDEHQVIVEHAPTRQSYLTNPFIVM